MTAVGGQFRVKVEGPDRLFIGFAAAPDPNAYGYDVTLAEAERIVEAIQASIASARATKRPACDRAWGPCACGINHVPCPDYDR